MKLHTRYTELFESLSHGFSTAIRFILNVLLVLICIALAIGVVKSGIDLFNSISKPADQVLQQILLDVVFIVALVEIAITVLGYLKDGEVQVRYIVDTILIIMLNEIVTLFFKGADMMELIGISIVVATLAAVRLSIVQSTPRNDGGNRPNIDKMHK